jgi:enolase-phosphatase E1
MDADAKVTGLKQLQASSGSKAFAMATCAALSLTMSARARPLESKTAVNPHLLLWQHSRSALFFAHTTAGDLTPRLSGYYDTTTGSKRESRQLCRHRGGLRSAARSNPLSSATSSMN